MNNIENDDWIYPTQNPTQNPTLIPYNNTSISNINVLDNSLLYFILIQNLMNIIFYNI